MAGHDESAAVERTEARAAGARAARERAAAEAVLAAGGVLERGAATGDDVDTLTARTYTHPALGDRKTVRLVPGALGEAEDLALDFLGMVREGEAPEVGQVRREALGFPAWALVNDPANGHHALALVKDVERLARQAKSRPGAAKDGFEALAARLGRSVPHFLPTFHEQAARAFLEQDNKTYAAAFFGKARDAERVHSLTVDEDRQRAVFLEFAFAGALTAKALKEYARDLTRRLDAASAWEQFRRLAVERCAAGVPPYSGMAEDARSMLRAAGLDLAAEERALLAELLASPAIARAPQSFWTALRTALVGLCAEAPSWRARLLEIMPAPSAEGDTAATDRAWLDLLHETGALALLTGERPAADPAPPTDTGTAAPATAATAAPVPARGAAADWLTRWSAHRTRGRRTPRRCAQTLGLATAMAPRLRSDGAAVRLFHGGWHSAADLDLLDLCLAEGVTVADPPSRARVDAGEWLADEAPGRRDLAAVAADPGHRRLLKDAVGRIGKGNDSASRLAALPAYPALRGALHDWLADRADEFTRAAGIPSASAVLATLHPFRAAAEVHPEAVARITGHDVAPLLARTLRAGIVDELGWPALEEAMLRVGDPVKTAPGLPDDEPAAEYRVDESWPALIVSRGNKAVVVGPREILLEHDLRIPDKLERWESPWFRYVDGDLLVAWHHDGAERAYWTSRPGEVFRLTTEEHGQRWWNADNGAPSLPLPGGGRAVGGRVLHPGGTAVPSRLPVLTDGTGYWALPRGRQGERRWTEYDPATGTLGRECLPAFLEAAAQTAAAAGGSLLPQGCELLPLQPGLEDSPFGTDGTLLGRWARIDKDPTGRTAVVGGVDGRTTTVPLAAQPEHAYYHRPEIPLGGLRLPGGEGPVLVLQHNTLTLRSADGAADELGTCTVLGRGGQWAAGTALVPPPAFWHALRPRDTPGSAVLRSLTDEQATALLTAVVGAITAPGAAGTVPVEAVTATLPGISHPALAAGVAAVARNTAGLLVSLARFASRRGDGNGEAEAYRPPHGDDATISRATAGLRDRGGHRYWAGRDTQWTVLPQIRAIADILGRPEATRDANRITGPSAVAPTAVVPDPPDLLERLLATADEAEADAAPPPEGWTTDPVPVPGGEWVPLLGKLGALAVRAAAHTTPEDEREALLLLLETMTQGPLADPGGRFRRLSLSEAQHRGQRRGQILRRGARTVVVLAQRGHSNNGVRWAALEYDPDGRFGPVGDFSLLHAHPVEDPVPAALIAETVRLVRDRGPLPWRPEAADALAAATGAAHAEAALVLCGLPNIDGYGRTVLPAAALREMGIKPAEATAAREPLKRVAAADRAAVLAGLLPADPAAWWETGPDTAGAARVWAERLGTVVRPPDDLLGGTKGMNPASVEAVLNPARTPWIARTTTQRIDRHNDRLTADDKAAVPSAHDLSGAVTALTHLAYRLPYGAPRRALLPEALAALRRRLADPGLLLDLDVEYTTKGCTSEPLREAAGLPAAGGEGKDGMVRVGEALVLTPWYRDGEFTSVRPAGLTGADDPVFDLLTGLRQGESHGQASLRRILGPGLERLVTAGNQPRGTGGVSEGFPEGFPQDPARSVPALVAEVAKEHGLGEDAAVLYLQLLALPDPTNAHVARWTGWRPARLKKARAELLASGLVVEAKRSRAGRTLFLPGGWTDVKSPGLPLETWKEKLYPVSTHAVLVEVPVPDLFAAAWQRTRDGDTPAFEELRIRRTGKGRRR